MQTVWHKTIMVEWKKVHKVLSKSNNQFQLIDKVEDKAKAKTNEKTNYQENCVTERVFIVHLFCHRKQRKKNLLQVLFITSSSEAVLYHINRMDFLLLLLLLYYHHMIWYAIDPCLNKNARILFFFEKRRQISKKVSTKKLFFASLMTTSESITVFRIYIREMIKSSQWTTTIQILINWLKMKFFFINRHFDRIRSFSNVVTTNKSKRKKIYWKSQVPRASIHTAYNARLNEINHEHKKEIIIMSVERITRKSRAKQMKEKRRNRRKRRKIV